MMASGASGSGKNVSGHCDRRSLALPQQMTRAAQQRLRIHRPPPLGSPHLPPPIDGLHNRQPRMVAHPRRPTALMRLQLLTVMPHAPPCPLQQLRQRSQITDHDIEVQVRRLLHHLRRHQHRHRRPTTPGTGLPERLLTPVGDRQPLCRRKPRMQQQQSVFSLCQLRKLRPQQPIRLLRLRHGRTAHQSTPASLHQRPQLPHHRQPTRRHRTRRPLHPYREGAHLDLPAALAPDWARCRHLATAPADIQPPRIHRSHLGRLTEAAPSPIGIHQRRGRPSRQRRRQQNHRCPRSAQPLQQPHQQTVHPRPVGMGLVHHQDLVRQPQQAQHVVANRQDPRQRLIDCSRRQRRQQSALGTPQPPPRRQRRTRVTHHTTRLSPRLRIHLAQPRHAVQQD